VPASSGRTEMPAGLRAVIATRADALSSATAERLQIAALIGSTFDVRLVQVVADAGEPQLDWLEEAEAAHLVRTTAGARGYHCEFVHELVRRVLAESVSRDRAAELHYRIGQAIEYLHRDDLRPYCGQVCTHYFQAGSHVPVDALVSASERAIEMAFQMYAWDEAGMLIHTTFETMRALGAPDDELANFIDRSLSSWYHVDALDQGRLLSLTEFALGHFMHGGKTDAEIRMKMAVAFGYQMENVLELHRPDIALSMLNELKDNPNPVIRNRSMVPYPNALIQLGRYDDARAASSLLLDSVVPGMRMMGTGYSAVCDYNTGNIDRARFNVQQMWQQSLAATGQNPAGLGGFAMAVVTASEACFLRAPLMPIDWLRAELALNRQSSLSRVNLEVWLAGVEREAGLPRVTVPDVNLAVEMVAASSMFAFLLEFRDGDWPGSDSPPRGDVGPFATGARRIEGAIRDPIGGDASPCSGLRRSPRCTASSMGFWRCNV
jgi:hypothetical protein